MILLFGKIVVSASIVLVCAWTAYQPFFFLKKGRGPVAMQRAKRVVSFLSRVLLAATLLFLLSTLLQAWIDKQINTGDLIFLMGLITITFCSMFFLAKWLLSRLRQRVSRMQPVAMARVGGKLPEQPPLLAKFFFRFAVWLAKLPISPRMAKVVLYFLAVVMFIFMVMFVRAIFLS